MEQTTQRSSQMKNLNLITKSWEDYELIDSGNNKKLERFGKFILIRPETQAIWEPTKPEEWAKANGEFSFDEGKGSWSKKDVPEIWDMSWGDAKFSLQTTSFKHIGIFPEQAANWEWLKEKVSKLDNPKVLNLFGYTGIASIVCAKSGAEVTHVDASKQSNAWAKENAELSGVPDDSIRYLLDDASKFVEREKRRGSKYDGIILDPPSFGRGPNNEVWKIEESLSKLIYSLKGIFSFNPNSFFLLNGYAAGYSPQSFLRVMNDVFPDANGEFGELFIKESDSEKVIPSGIYVRFEV